MTDFRFVDLFCGGGGSITGAINALHAADMRYEGRGFNHWELAVRTIQTNHPEIVPDFERACAPIESVLPDEIFATEPTRIDVVWASPSCTQHSRARGGIPKSNQLRCQPEFLLPYLRLTKCRRMFVENVTELQKWGPVLDEDLLWKGKMYKAGTPDPRKIGAFFNLWYKEIKESGYKVDMCVMNAADYGAATSRERLIIQAVRKSSGDKIIWPEPTHLQDPGLFVGQYKPWRSAAEIIDWSIQGESIFDRAKPLCENTLKRIEAGIRKYWGAWAEPFLIALRGNGDGQIALSHPLPNQMNIMPFLIRYNGGEDRNHGTDAPLPVIDCSNRYGVIQPLFLPQQSAGTAKPTSEPMPTIATSGAIGLVQPFLLKYYGNERGADDIHAPLDTITTKDRFGLVQGRILTLPDGRQFKLDITHRMLTASELARATSFPDGYIFCGGDTAAKKQIGNAVPPKLAEALYRAILAA